MEFDMEKYTRLIMKSGKRKTTERIGQQNQEDIRTLGKKKNYKLAIVNEGSPKAPFSIATTPKCKEG